MADDRDASDGEGLAGRESVWDGARVKYVVFDVPRVPTVETLGALKELIPSLEVERVAAESDKADSRTKFLVGVEVAWDEEHERQAEFRDGALVEFRVE